jgi:predicted GH43/DUF377 family glycosyl hydrolase
MKLTSFLFTLFTCMMVVSSCNPKETPASSSLPAWAIGEFIRPEGKNPVISPGATSRFFCPLTGDSVDWESNDTFNPAATVYDGKIIVLYRAEDRSGEGIGGRTSRLGYASSTDGVTFERRAAPVLYPSNDSQKELEWPGGCEDPRLVATENGTYVVFYTQWNRRVPRLAVATSRDLLHWEKHGPAFAAACGGKFFDEPSKSAAVVTQVINDRQLAVKINGKYWMYWGEKKVYAATSSDLIRWEPLLTETGELQSLFEPRKGYFDSELTECGPPAVLTDQGIVLLYNGKNSGGEDRDTCYTANAYCAGQALFDANNPRKFITRLDKPFLRPADDFEKSGQYPAGTVFVEGLVYYHKAWYLYYGCADSRVAVAICRSN